METQGEEAQPRRSPSPPPPPPPPPPPTLAASGHAQPSLHRQELERGGEAEAANKNAADQEMEQGAEVLAAASSSSEDHADVTEEHGEGKEGAEEDAVAEAEEGPAVLTDDLREKIVRQVEYYFSDENLPNDKFMLKCVKKDKQGFVSIAVIASFRRMKRLVKDLSLIEAALRTSSQLFVSKDGKKVRRLHPLPNPEIKDTKSCTVIVENLPDDYSTDNLQKIFASVGKILNISIHDPHLTEDSKQPKKHKIVLSSKLHAVIEYETTEAAANAVVKFNDEKNWRSGMRVEILRKRMGKYGFNHIGHKEVISEKNNDDQTSEVPINKQTLKSDTQHGDKTEKQDEENVVGDKGRRKNRYRSQGRGQQGASGQGHGQVTSSMSKPLPGPRMPDGTRGFTMGRGKPSTSEPIQQGA